MSVSALPAADGPGLEAVHSIRDISRLKQADEAKTLFLATASHESKTPLTVINGFAKTLTTRNLPPDRQREALASIRRRGEELARVVDRLLLSSRIEAGRAEVGRTEVDLIPSSTSAIPSSTSAPRNSVRRRTGSSRSTFPMTCPP